MRKMIVGMALALAALAAWALPTLEQVENEVRLGHLTSAESMMSEVVAAKPGSARAHYVYAEVLARNGNFAAATEQARLARQSDPQITFTDPAKFAAFESLLAREGRVAGVPGRTAVRADQAQPASRTAGSATSAIPGWIWGALLAVAAVLLWRGFSRSRASAGASGAAGYPGTVAMPPAQAGYPTYGSQPPYGSPGAPGARSGMLGTGLAAAGGFAAGMLADELMHRHRDASSPGTLDNLGPSGLDAAGSDPAAMELETRPIDFGNGTGWDAGADTGDASGLDPGSFDAGGGSDWS